MGACGLLAFRRTKANSMEAAVDGDAAGDSEIMDANSSIVWALNCCAYLARATTSPAWMVCVSSGLAPNFAQPLWRMNLATAAKQSIPSGLSRCSSSLFVLSRTERRLFVHLTNEGWQRRGALELTDGVAQILSIERIYCACARSVSSCVVFMAIALIMEIEWGIQPLPWLT